MSQTGSVNKVYSWFHVVPIVDHAKLTIDCLAVVNIRYRLRNSGLRNVD